MSDEYVSEYTREHQEKSTSFEKILSNFRMDAVQRSLSKRGPNSVLEIGCGFNPGFTEGPTVADWTVIEPQHEFVEYARQQADESVEIIEGRVEEVAEELETFDFIAVSSVLHEVSNPDELMDAVRRLADNKTLIHINVPNANSFHRLLAEHMGLIDSTFEMSQRDKNFERNRHYNRQNLTEYVTESGFDVVGSGTYFFKPFTVDQMEMIIDSSEFPDELLQGLDSISQEFPDMGCELYVEAVKDD